MGAEWQLVGRENELRTLRNLLVRRKQCVVLAGASGVGKTRLGAEALDMCRGEGFAVAGVRATRASSQIPLGAFAPLLPSGSEPSRGQVDEKATLLNRCAHELTSRALGRQLVLGVDDAHLLDDMSATLVHQLAESGAAVLVATVRSAASAPDPVVALWKDNLAERVEVKGLTTEAVTEVVAGTLKGSVDDAAVADLMTRSGGNMLFLRELAFGALADGALRNESGVWRLVGDLRPSDRLVELIETRLGGLTERERALLEIVAFGEPLGPSELSDLSEESVAESLERKGLLKSTQDGLRLTVRLGHPLYGDVLRERIPALRARSITRALAESVEATGARRREDLLRIATWRLVGGGAKPGLMYDAAIAARWRYDFSLAERLARAALDAGGGFEAALLAAQLAGLQGRSEQADAELAALAESAAGPDHAALIALIRLDNRVIYAGTIDEGLKIAEDVEATLPPSEQRDGITARRSALLLAKDGPARAMSVLEPLLDRAQGRALAWACMPGAYSLARMGRITEALATARRGFTVQSALATPTDWYPWMHVFYEAEALAHSGRFTEAESLALCQYRYGVSTRSLEAQAMFSWHLAKTVADRGNIEDAVRHSTKAVSIYRQLGRPQFVDFCLIYQAQAQAMANRPTEAAESLRRLGIRPSYFMGIDLLQAQGWVVVAGGNLREARKIFLRAGVEGERIGDLVGALAALHGAARIGYPKEVAPRVAKLAGLVEGALAPARAAHVCALAERDPAALERVSAEFEAMGALLLAAESAADAAVGWDHGRDGRRKASAQRRAERLANRCPGARTPALHKTETRARLTPSEWETAQLAASGQSNREIADRLVVSVRTVENCLQHVYNKLGIRSRAALTDALGTEAAPTGSRRSVQPS